MDGQEIIFTKSAYTFTSIDHEFQNRTKTMMKFKYFSRQLPVCVWPDTGGVRQVLVEQLFTLPPHADLLSLYPYPNVLRGRILRYVNDELGFAWTLDELVPVGITIVVEVINTKKIPEQLQSETAGP